jgi:hypothetical protein
LACALQHLASASESEGNRTVNARVPIHPSDDLLQVALANAAKPARSRVDAIPELSHADVLEIERRARELRAELIADLFARVGRWIERALWRAAQRDVEYYLSQATDAADLERRMRTLERLPRSDVLGSFR